MIVVAGLTPAYQQIMIYDQLRPGEVNRAREVRWCSSGKVLNVAIALSRLGGPLLTIAPLGGLAGRTIEREFEENDVAARWVVTKAPTRVCTTLVETSPRRITELVETARPMTADELHLFAEAFAPALHGANYLVMSGSLPASAPASYFHDLIVRGALSGKQLILDIRGPELIAALNRQPLLVKPNRAELAETVGRPLPKDEDVLQAMRGLNAQGAEWVLVSDGERATWLTTRGAAYRFAPAQVKQIENPIGCGDVLAAGVAWALRAGRDMPEAVRVGMGAAADNLVELLPARIDARRSLDRAKSITMTKLTSDA